MASSASTSSSSSSSSSSKISSGNQCGAAGTTFRRHLVNVSSVFLLLFATLSPLTGVTGVRISDLQVPDLIYLNEGFWMNCSFDLENEPLYSIKWFKKNNEVKEEGPWSEIYSYIMEGQHAEATKRTFPTRGVRINESSSSQGNVFLMAADHETEGTYKCEVSADAPTFETVREERETRLYHFLQNQPAIRGMKSEYMVDSYLEAVCVIVLPDPKLKSMTQLSWFMNDEPIPRSYLRSFRRPSSSSSAAVVHNSDGSQDGVNHLDRETEMSRTIRFMLNAKHFDNGPMRLRCSASSIPPLFARSTEVIVRREPLTGASSPGRYSSASNRVTICSRLSFVVVLLSALIHRTGLAIRIS